MGNPSHGYQPNHFTSQREVANVHFLALTGSKAERFLRIPACFIRRIASVQTSD